MAIAEPARSETRPGPRRGQPRRGRGDRTGATSASLVDNYRTELGVEMYINLDHISQRGGRKGGHRRRLRVHPHRLQPGQEGRHRRGDHRSDPRRRRVRRADDRRAGGERAALLRWQLQRAQRRHRLRRDPQDLLHTRGRRGVRRRDRHRHVRGGGRQPPRPLPGPQDSSTSSCCNRSARRSTSTSACTAAAAPPVTTSSRPPTSASANQHQLRPAVRLPHHARSNSCEPTPTSTPSSSSCAPVIRAVQDVVEDRIDLFGAAGKAQP